MNEFHEPPFFFGVNRPEVERRIIPTTWRENGVGIFGTAFAETLSYRAYVVNGFNARGYGPGGLRGGRQKGNRALAEDLAFVARADWSPTPELLLGGSVYNGDAGQDQEITVGATDVGIPNARTLPAVHAARALETACADETVEVVRRRAHEIGEREPGVDPQDLWALSETLSRS